MIKNMSRPQCKCTVFYSLLILPKSILIFDQNIKNNKNNALIPQYTPINFSDIYDIIINFCSFPQRKYYVQFLLNVRWMLCILFFIFISKICIENVPKPTNNKRPKQTITLVIRPTQVQLNHDISPNVYRDLILTGTLIYVTLMSTRGTKCKLNVWVKSFKFT